MLKHAMVGAVLAVVAACAHAGPFGLEMGQKVEELQGLMNLSKSANYSYEAASAPKAHPSFQRYILLITPEHGLCRVTALSNFIKPNSYGSEVKEQFKVLEEALTSRYGAPSDRYDYLLAGSVWREPRDWLMGLIKNERTLSSYWGGAGKDIGDHVDGIKLEALAEQPGLALITLVYEFQNADACLSWVKAKRNESL